MIELEAWQYAYGYVELNRSPVGKSGFQTLGYSHAGLSYDQVFEIQSRVAPRGKIATARRRWAFFQLQSGPFVFVQAVPIAERDSSGRGGAFMAHGFLLSVESFRMIENNPLAVFSHAPFITSQDDLLDRITAGGDVQSATLQIPTEHLRSMAPDQTWSADQLLRLAHLALCAKILRHENTTVAFVGMFDDIVSGLKTVIAVVPPQRRIDLSFNTAFDGCNPVNNYFWGAGFAKRPAEVRYLVVNATHHRIVGAVTPAGLPEGPYFRWLQATLAAKRAAGVAQWSNQAWTLHQLLRRETVDLQKAQQLDSRFASQFLDLNRSELAELVEGAVRSRIASTLVPVVRAGIERRYTGNLERLHRGIAGFSDEELSDIAFEYYTELAASTIPKAERQAVADLARATSSAKLQALVAVWNRDLRRLARVAGQLPHADYRRVAGHALRDRTLSLSQLIIPGQADCALSAFADNLSPTQVLRLCKVLVDQHQIEALERLAPQLGYLSFRDLSRVKRIVRDVALPPGFANAMNTAYEQARRDQSDLLGGLQALLFGEKDDRREDGHEDP